MQKKLPRIGACPRQFCRQWFGISSLPVDEIAECETESDYRRKCVKLLARVLGLKERTIRGWGSGLNFEKMPQCHRLALAYALQATEGEQKNFSNVA
ncbi:MAG: hypothetical protein KME49_22760 [Brasilonema octagenarum HA4186-MV1]|jgi:hypothetical protein|nr:hypothetical protein [Brasilonema octagenarum HA4186-MV1]